MKECSKATAYMNAQAVMASAIMFGHGDVVTLSVNDSAIVLTLVFDSAWFVEERETEWLMQRCMCGVKHWNVDDFEADAFALYVSWEFNSALK